MQLDHAWLLAHLPHQGSMCLLSCVDTWDEQHIRCTANSHRDPHNPLRAHGRLGVACGIEYAAQAIAAHGALMAGNNHSLRAGYLANVRNVNCQVVQLDDIVSDLTIEAQRISGDDTTILYSFKVSSDAQLLLSGRAIVVLDAASLGAHPIGGSA